MGELDVNAEVVDSIDEMVWGWLKGWRRIRVHAFWAGVCISKQMYWDT
jgi:hypothetical protein